METKKFTKFELARMKRTAQNVDSYIKQKNKLEAKMAEIESELNSIKEQIELMDAPTVAMTGYHTEEIIRKVVTPTGQHTKNGQEIKRTTFEFIYPETIVPPVVKNELENNTVSEDKVEADTTDAETSTETVNNTQVTEDSNFGSDNDIDFNF